MSRLMTMAVMLCGSVLALSTAASGQDYEIRFVRPMTVGQEFSFTATGEITQKAVKSLGEKQAQSGGAFSYELEAGAKVEAIDDNGQPTQLTLTVTKCTRTDNGQQPKPKPLVTQSTTVKATMANNQRTFEIDGQPAPQELGAVLQDAVLLGGGGGGITDDAVFGPQGRKKVGDQWNINADEIIKDLTQRGISTLTKDNVEGTVTVEKATQVDGVDCLDLHCVVKMKGLPCPWQGLTCEESTVEADQHFTLPVDTKLGCLTVTQVTTSHIVAGAQSPDPQSPPLRIEASMSGKKTVKYTYTKAEAKK